MTVQQWNAFCNFKEAFNNQIKIWNERCPNLQEYQKQAAKQAKTPDYSFETPIVYNKDLDRITLDDEIKLIVIGDNPGKDEQLIKNNRYLVGQAGKIADGFFKRKQELQIDFRKNVIILNKTPIHSAKTSQLKKMMTLGGQSVQDLLLETQIWMAENTALLHQQLGKTCELWLVGYSELKEKGIFVPYRDELKKSYLRRNSNQKEINGLWENVYVFQHFSMNRFSIDLNSFRDNENQKNNSLIDSIHQLGYLHKKEIFEK